MTEQWEANYKDGNGWQRVDAEAVALEISDAEEIQAEYDDNGHVRLIDTGHAKYRRVKRSTQPLENRSRVKETDDGMLWAN